MASEHEHEVRRWNGLFLPLDPYYSNRSPEEQFSVRLRSLAFGSRPAERQETEQDSAARIEMINYLLGVVPDGTHGVSGNIWAPKLSVQKHSDGLLSIRAEVSGPDRSAAYTVGADIASVHDNFGDNDLRSHPVLVGRVLCVTVGAVDFIRARATAQEKLLQFLGRAFSS